MSFNWGAFLGAAGNSAINTMDKLQAIELQKLQNERLKRQVADEEGFRKAVSEVDAQQYNGGTAIPVLAEQGLSSDKFTPEQKEQLGKDLASMPPEQASAALGALSSTGHTNEGYDFSKIGVYQGKDGQMLGTNDYTPIDPSKRSALVLDRMLKEGNLYGVEKGLMLNKGLREYEATQRYDKYREETVNMQKDLTIALTDKGISHAPDVINPYLEGTDYSVKYVAGKNGPGQIMVYERGKPTGQSYGDMQSIIKAATVAKTMQLRDNMMDFFSDPKDFANWLAKEQELELKKREVAAKERETAAKVGYYGASAKNVGKGTPTAFYNSNTRQTAFVDPKNPSGLIDVYGKPIADSSGFEPVALVQTRLGRSAATTKGYVNPIDNSTATMVDGVLIGSDGQPVKNPAAYREVGSKTSDTPEAVIEERANELLNSGAARNKEQAIEMARAVFDAAHGNTGVVGEPTAVPDAGEQGAANSDVMRAIEQLLVIANAKKMEEAAKAKAAAEKNASNNTQAIPVSP